MVCSGKVYVIDTVNLENDIYRKQRCVKCKHTLYTTEFEVEYEDMFRDEWNANYRKKSRR